HAHPAARDSAYRQLLVTGKSELAHDENVERDAECPRDLEAHGYSASRQCEDDDIASARILEEPGGELATRFRPACKASHSPRWPGNTTSTTGCRYFPSFLENNVRVPSSPASSR